MLMNARTGEVVAADVEVADTREKRRRGLLGRSSMNPSSALILLPCFSIHTAFMQFPIDAVFVNREGIVVRVVRNMRPWRIAVSLRARAVVEFAGGSLDPRDMLEGDRLYLTAETPRSSASMSWPMSA
jgi:uncharacterized membrane protein (UPF0127 family)